MELSNTVDDFTTWLEYIVCVSEKLNDAEMVAQIREEVANAWVNLQDRIANLKVKKSAVLKVKEGAV